MRNPNGTVVRQGLLTSVFFLTLSGISALPASGQISVAESVLTGRNNVQRTGVYDHERQLTRAKVSDRQRFRKLVSRIVDGQVAAQPLYVKGVTIKGVPNQNVLYVVTRKNTVYAFYADNVDPNDPKQGQAWDNPIHLVDCDPPAPQSCWNDPRRQGALEAVPLNGSEHCLQTIGPVGITSTPVIDSSSQSLYLVARFGAPKGDPGEYGKNVYHYLISLDITTGREIRRVPIGSRWDLIGRRWVPIHDQSGNSFLAAAELNRPALLLLNHILYIAFGAPVCDTGENKISRADTHGWVFAYSVPTMDYLGSYNTSPQKGLAGIWQSGAGLAGDPAGGFVYALTGNNNDADFVYQNQTGVPGTRNFADRYHPARTELGESILKLRFGIGGFEFDNLYTNPVVPHFTAGNWYRLDTGLHCMGETPTQHCPNAPNNWRDPIVNGPPDGDSDLGSGGPVVLSSGLVVGGGKQGRLYVLDPTTNFHDAKQTVQAGINTWHLGSQTTCTTNNPASDPNPKCVVSEDDYDVAQAWGPNIHGTPAVWERPSKPYGYLYLMAEKDYLRAYRVLHDGHIVDSAPKTSESVIAPDIFKDKIFRSPDGMPGGAVSISSNGDNEGIVWVSVSPTNDATTQIRPGVLAAFDAETLQLLWYDDDKSIKYAKFVPPTIAGGKVFRATFGEFNELAPVYTSLGGRRVFCPVGKPGEYEGTASCGSIAIYGYSIRGQLPVTRGVRKPK